MTTKGERRAERKANVAEGRPYHWEPGEDGLMERVRPRTRAEERSHERAMERWARLSYEHDGDPRFD